MRILVDMDGVLADFEGGFLEIWQREHPDKAHLPRQERKSFFLVRQYPKEFRSIIWDIILAPGFFASFPPIPGGLEAVQEILALGHEVFICSSPMLGNPTCASDKFNWIEARLGRDWSARLILATDKSLVDGDVLIDDRPGMAERGIQTPTWTHILFDQPYNRHLEEQPRLDWSNWKEVLLNGQFGH